MIRFTARVDIGLIAFPLLTLSCRADRGAFETPQTFDEPSADAGECLFQCSVDGRSIIRSCTGDVVETCPPDLACGAATCQEPCAAAIADRRSNACEFYFQTPILSPSFPDSCYAAFVVNTSLRPVEIALEHAGKALDLSKSIFRTNLGDSALIPHTGAIAPGTSVILFVSDLDPEAPRSEQEYIGCPTDAVPAVYLQRSLRRTGIASSFHLKATAPVSLTAMYPFGGAASFLPSTTLILPSGTWAKEHIIINGWEAGGEGNPTTQIIASEDDTEVTVFPKRDIQDNGIFKGTPAGVAAKYHLDRGQVLQFVQFEELSGSVVASNRPITTFGGHSCANIPVGGCCCDALLQQIPAFEQWGSEYAAAGYRPRLGDERETMPYRIVAARDGTRLDYDPVIPLGAPTEMAAGESATFPAGVGDAFVVRTQDSEHPIYLGAYMTSVAGGYFGSASLGTAGDPEFVNVVPAGQYLNSYSFYADPTYDETSLVVVRAKTYGTFKDVWLECAGKLTDFRPVGTRGDYEWIRVDLTRQGGAGQTFGEKTCRSGLHHMKSDGPFTAMLWGWANWASYAYPGGMAHRKLVSTPLIPIR